MKSLLLVGLVVCVSVAHATTFTVEGDWDGSGGGVVCSNSGTAGAGCQASIPHNYLTLDGVVYDAGGINFFATESLGFDGSYPNNFYPANKPEIAITGSISESVGGVGPHPISLQPGATISGSLDIPSDWGNVGVYGYVTEETNQYNSNPSGQFQADLSLRADGQEVDATRLYPGTFLHTAGDPFSISWSRRIT